LTGAEILADSRLLGWDEFVKKSTAMKVKNPAAAYD